MKRMVRVALAGLVVVMLLSVAIQAVAVERQTAQANIKADRFKANIGTGEWEFSGNCRVEIKGPDNAVMTAPRVTGRFDRSGSQVVEIRATGPVDFDVTTRRDSEGVQRRIVAKATTSAVYSAAARTITLSGSPQAAVSTIPSPPDVRPATFSGRTLVVRLDDEVTIEGEGVVFDVELPPAEDTQQEPGT